MSGHKYCVRTYVCVYRVTFRVTCANKCVCELRQPSYTAQIRIIEYPQTSLSEQTTVQMGEKSIHVFGENTIIEICTATVISRAHGYRRRTFAVICGQMPSARGDRRI